MRVSVDGKMGTLTRIIGRKARVDYNHVLADKVVKYDYTIVERIEDRLEKLEGLIRIFAKIDLKTKILDGDVAEIESPWEMSYYREWPMMRRGSPRWRCGSSTSRRSATSRATRPLRPSPPSWYPPRRRPEEQTSHPPHQPKINPSRVLHQ